MSGGFFRGTSADQDTRFSNKQAKLLKSQKFAPELENLVDMSKVNMDVMRPWIAKRVTELIGFEDEVLINFIYGLLEGKAVNGKEIQISLTGFMERNTGKFMKELWALLLSAQQNVSGIPQQFLDAKEEETKKKKAESDRIANEIHKNKEKERLEFEQEKKRMGGDDSMSRDTRTEVGIDVKHDGREFSIPQEDDKERIKRNGRKEHRVSRSPDSTYQSRSPRRKHSSASPSKSSNSRSRSNERGRSRSTSGGPPSRNRSISSERQRHPGRERSATLIRRRNVRRSPSPRPAPLHSKRRSTSHSRYRSPSPARPRVRSPVRRRSRSPMRRRSRSPLRRRSRSRVRRRSRTPVRRSPLRYRSRTPLRRRSPSPIRRRSPSPIRRRSPSPRRRRSPSPRRRRSPSPIRRRSPSPIRRRSPSPTRRRSPSPVRHRSPSPVQRRSPSPVRHRSPSPVRRRSPSPVRRRSPSPVHRSRSPIRRKSPLVSGKSPSPVYHSSPSPRHRRLASPTRRSSPPLRHKPSPTRRQYQRSPSNPRQQSISPARGRLTMRDRKRSSTPVRQTSTREESSSPLDVRHGSHSPIERGSMRSMRSPIQSPRGRTRRHDNYSPARRASPGERAEIPVENRKGVRSSGSKPAVSLRSPQRDTLDHDDLHEKDRDLLSSVQKSPVVSHFSRSKSDSDEQREISPHGSHETFDDGAKLKKRNSEKVHDRMVQKEPDVCQELSGTHKTTGLGVKGMENSDDDGGARGKGKKTNRADESKRGHQLSQQETSQKLSRNPERNNQNGSWNSPSKEADEGRIKVKEKRKHKKLDSQEIESDDYSSDDSYEERKEAKKRRREEKKMKKEKRRRRREDKRRRREERRAEKLKSKSGDSDSSSSEDPGRRHAENDKGRLRDSRASNTQGTEFDQKKLEIELREKALETLRAKKGFGN